MITRDLTQTQMFLILSIKSSSWLVARTVRKASRANYSKSRRSFLDSLKDSHSQNTLSNLKVSVISLDHKQSGKTYTLLSAN